MTVAWDANSEPTVIGYRVYVGTSPSVYAESFDAGNTTTFTYANGIAGVRYYFAVAAYNSSNAEGPRSGAISALIASASGTPPGGSEAPGGEEPPPGGETGGIAGDTIVVEPPPPPPPPPSTGGETGGLILETAAVSGPAVTFRWTPVAPLNPTAYALEVGTTPGGSDIYNAPAGSTTTFSASVQPGAYFARVRARLPEDESAISNEIGFAVGDGACTAAPKTPAGVAGHVAWGVVATVTWPGSARASSYIVQMGDGPGRSNLYHGNVGSANAVTANVSIVGAVYARVIAVNGCGRSAASEEVRLQ